MITTAQIATRLARHRLALLAAGAWVGAHLAVLALADGALPFDRPALATAPFAMQMAVPSLGLIEIFGLMALVGWMTRRRAIPDMAARAPARPIPARETAALLAYALLGQVGGWPPGPAPGHRPVRFHYPRTPGRFPAPASPGEG